MDGNKTEADPSIKQKEEEGLEEDEQDISLVEGVARINLQQRVKPTDLTNGEEHDGNGDGEDHDDGSSSPLPLALQSRPIEIAFIRDQDGALLGYKQFFDFKKSIKEGESASNDNDNGNGEDGESGTSTARSSIGEEDA